MFVHALPRTLWVPILDGFENFAMFAARRLAVILNINRGEHDALHLGAGFVNRLDEHLVARQTRNRAVKGRICFDESDAALPAVRSTSNSGEFGELTKDIRATAFEGS